ncbi:MAG TPA: hypothetical protein PK733_05350 [Clostridiales bacterium]|nr:hypothetical protein [Clostridiales bacterium]
MSLNKNKYLNIIEYDNYINVDNDCLNIKINRKTGSIAEFLLKEKNVDILDGEIGYIALHYKTAEQLCFTPDDVKLKSYLINKSDESNVLYMNLVSCKCDTELNIELKMEDGNIRLNCTPITSRPKMCEVEVVYVLPFFKANVNGFTPYSDADLLPEEIDHKLFIYGGDQFRGELSDSISLPLAGFYNKNENYGITVVQPVDIYKPQVQYYYVRENAPLSFVVKYCNLRLSKYDSPKTSIIFSVHEGDWRCSLKAIYDLYPEYFNVNNNSIYETEGTMLCSTLQPEENIKNWVLQQDLKWQEIHANIFPYYGLYAPEVEEWNDISNVYDISKLNLNRLIDIEFWEMGHSMMKYSNDKKIAKKDVNNYIEMLHKYGIGAFIYINAVILNKYEKEKYKDSEAIGLDGLPCFKNYYLNNPMNPDPGLSWGQNIIYQIEKILNYFPECDGLFFDELHFRHFDMNHDDGITAVNDKPSYMIGFAIEKISKLIYEKIENSGKSIWGNGPTSLEVMRYIDGLMAENSWKWLGTVQYYALNKPIVLLQSRTESIIELEEILKNAFICGSQVHVVWKPDSTRGTMETGEMLPDNDKEKLALLAGYSKILKLLKKRSWYLKAHCLNVLDDNYKGNIFKIPSGGYVVTLINKKHASCYESVEIELLLDDDFTVNKIYNVDPESDENTKIEWGKIANSINGVYIKLKIKNSIAIVIE